MSLIEKLIPAPGFYIIAPLTIQQSSSKVLLSESSNKDAYKKGTIIAAGGITYDKNGVALEPFFKIGDQVRFADNNLELIHEETETAYVIPFRSVVCKYS